MRSTTTDSRPTALQTPVCVLFGALFLSGNLLFCPAPSKPRLGSRANSPQTRLLAELPRRILSSQGKPAVPARDVPVYPEALCHLLLGKGTDCVTALYQTADCKELVQQYYQQILPRQGWQPVKTSSPETGLSVYSKDRRTAIIQVAPDTLFTRIGIVILRDRPMSLTRKSKRDDAGR